MRFLNKIINYFKKDEKKDSYFDLPDDHPLHDRYYEFKDVIIDHINRVTEDNMHFMHDPVEFGGVKDSRYLIDMYMEIAKMTYYTIDIKEIRDMDYKHMGHIDYTHKFAFELAEREQELTIEMLKGLRNDYKRRI